MNFADEPLIESSIALGNISEKLVDPFWTAYANVTLPQSKACGGIVDHSYKFCFCIPDPEWAAGGSIRRKILYILNLDLAGVACCFVNRVFFDTFLVIVRFIGFKNLSFVVLVSD